MHMCTHSHIHVIIIILISKIFFKKTTKRAGELVTQLTVKPVSNAQSKVQLFLPCDRKVITVSLREAIDRGVERKLE